MGYVHLLTTVQILKLLVIFGTRILQLHLLHNTNFCTISALEDNSNGDLEMHDIKMNIIVPVLCRNHRIFLEILFYSASVNMLDIVGHFYAKFKYQDSVIYPICAKLVQIVIHCERVASYKPKYNFLPYTLLVLKRLAGDIYF